METAKETAESRHGRIGTAAMSTAPDPFRASGAHAKSRLRSRILATRREMGAQRRAAAGAALRDVTLAYPEVAGAAAVAVYVSVGTEPDTRGLLDALRERGTRVLLPVLLPDGDLDWAYYDGDASLTAADRGLLEPVTPRLGVDAVRDTRAVLVPAVAVDTRGFRLGRGGGSYDRVLARVGRRTRTAALLYDGEVVDAVPTEPHDQRVGAALTPSGAHRMGLEEP